MSINSEVPPPGHDIPLDILDSLDNPPPIDVLFNDNGIFAKMSAIANKGRAFIEGTLMGTSTESSYFEIYTSSRILKMETPTMYLYQVRRDDGQLRGVILFSKANLANVYIYIKNYDKDNTWVYIKNKPPYKVITAPEGGLLKNAITGGRRRRSTKRTKRTKRRSHKNRK